MKKTNLNQVILENNELVSIMNSDKLSIYYSNRLNKAITSPDDVKNFVRYYRLYKGEYALSLMVKNFIYYKADIEKMISLDEWLRSELICDSKHYYGSQSLQRLSKLMITKADKELFIDICERQKSKDNGFLLHILHEFLRAKNQPYFKNRMELSKCKLITSEIAN